MNSDKKSIDVSSISHATSDSDPGISVVVPCRNERCEIENAVLSILSQEPPPGGFEVIVADGMSDDGTRIILSKLAEESDRLRIVDNPAGIVPTALNIAIRQARGNIIIRMDAHTGYAPDYIRRCVEALTETAADNVGGPWVARGQGLIGRAISAAFESPFCAGGARGHDPNYSGPVDTVYLGCWRREVFAKVGLFDEELVRNQDDEFNLRLTRAGGKIWQSAKIKSWYTPRDSVAALFRQYVQYGYWKVRVIQKHKAPASLRHLVPGTFVLLIIILPMIGLAWSPAQWMWLGLLGAYAVCNTTVSLIAAPGENKKLFPSLMIVFAVFHFAYGYGFLRGIWDFIIMRRRPASKYTMLTRPSTGF
jgi:Glycosyltransferases, probably involved in cell wall biogenesis